jgi:hypothetical protein
MIVEPVFSRLALPPLRAGSCKSAVCGDHFVGRETPRVRSRWVIIF